MTNTTTTETEKQPGEYIHPWEKAGLGKAPFRWMGITEEIGPRVYAQPDGTTLTVGSEGQPMGCCAYCGQGIAECHHIRSADGKNFTVGCDCVRKVNAKGSKVLTAAEKASRARVTDRRRARESAAIAEGEQFLARADVRAFLVSRPSLTKWRAEQGDTLADYIDFVWPRCGHAGKLRLIAQIREAFAAA